MGDRSKKYIILFIIPTCTFRFLPYIQIDQYKQLLLFLRPMKSLKQQNVYCRKTMSIKGKMITENTK